ncbi:MAG: metal-dependent hydrolase [Caldimonas sp.]
MSGVRTVCADDIAPAWCNADLDSTCVMEAVSFVTPALERFLVHAVALQMRRRPELAMRERCLAFIREESSHRTMHARLNVCFRLQLDAAPRGLAGTEAWLARARNACSPATQMLLAAAIEHLTAVLSLRYLRQSQHWTFSSPAARAVFDEHARDEVAHRAVVFDVSVASGAAGRLGRGCAMLAVALGALLYVTLAAPSILQSKTQEGRVRSMLAIARLGLRNVGEALGLAREAAAFAYPGFHPDMLLAEDEEIAPDHRGDTHT